MLDLIYHHSKQYQFPRDHAPTLHGDSMWAHNLEFPHHLMPYMVSHIANNEKNHNANIVVQVLSPFLSNRDFS